jgi:AraC family transcriptional regulator, L-rhamnose operon transcriptional activator RhaR
MGSEPAIYSRKAIFTADHAATMVNRVEVNGDNDLHGHDFFEIALAAGGSGKHVSATGEYTLEEGTVVFIRPGAWHGYKHCDRLIIHNCCFDQHLLLRELSWLREDTALNFLLWTGPYAADRKGVMVLHLLENRLADCLSQLEFLRQVQDMPGQVETIGRLLIFLNCLSGAINTLKDRSQQTRLYHPAVLETMRVLESNIGQPWALRELAARSHLAPSYLVRLFKAEIGLTPIAYLNRCRVERAAGLLLHTLHPIAEIAAQVGWYDPNLFARRFRAAYRMSPSEYRNQFGRNNQVTEAKAHKKHRNVRP